MKWICLQTSWKRTEEFEKTVTHSSDRAYTILQGKTTRLFILSSWLADQDFVREIRAVIGQSLWQNNGSIWGDLQPQHLWIAMICSLDISQQFFIPIILDVKNNTMQINYYWKCFFFDVVFFTIGGSQYLNIICIKICMMTLLYADLGVCICAYTFTIFNRLSLRLSKTKGKLFLILSCFIKQAIQMCVFKYLLYVRVHLQPMSCFLTKQINMQQWDT